ncbi:galactose ABC transporter substrate-binding protein [Clostridium sp.]|jgi:methyl-galactoside transport system substrate-binding protein|uniref:galactose ABC transporter substrate-binding protein n=1 Tax=Clostridium sp. TaxID=1506 RepID=UPI00283BC86C|nr:galactose ABC transporter substrate-binding protein [Clostridium sp.]MDR3597457.1 galactose ABC transporter substrate-binding protein [Clostridium sp.]
MKRILKVIMITFMVIVTLTNCSKKLSYMVFAQAKPIKAAVFLLDFTDDFISLIGKNLEDIQKENPDKVVYTFYDGKSNQDIQNKQIDKVLEEGTDLILLNIVNRGESQAVINKIKETNIPVILFNREPLTPTPIQSYNKALYIGTDSEQIGMLQGKMIVDVWDTSKKYIDKNNDGIMQYIMLEGESDNQEAILRTKYSVSTIEGAGIKTDQLALRVCDWLEDLAYEAMKSLFLKYGTQIEVIIANDDTMAIGAIKALQEYGYNKGDKSQTIPIVGVDVTPEAKELIEKGEMLGSVYQSGRAYAEALYACGMNLVAGKNPVEGTKYKLDDTGVRIYLPETDYLYKNIFLSR